MRRESIESEIRTERSEDRKREEERVRDGERSRKEGERARARKGKEESERAPLASVFSVSVSRDVALGNQSAGDEAVENTVHTNVSSGRSTQSARGSEKEGSKSETEAERTNESQTVENEKNAPREERSCYEHGSLNTRIAQIARVGQIEERVR